MANKSKILLCGDVEGRFNTLFKKVDTIQEKSGPFDLLICVGNFFGLNNKEFQPYRKGELKVPVSTLILGANSEDHIRLFSENCVELCENVQYLGKRGVYVSTNGLKIAYLSGIATNGDSKKGHEYNNEDVVALRDICLSGNSNFRGVDVLLTSQWPTNITDEDPNWNSQTFLSSASYHCAWLAIQLRPRYHISGLEGIFFERAPFRVPDPNFATSTRFLGMARVGNTNKHKWIYALSVTPLEKMKISDLSQKTTDETKCPYNLQELDSRVTKKRVYSADEKQQYFYDMSSGPEKTERKFTKKAKIEFDQSKCWFCLSSPSVEKHLIITIGNSTYVALAKGGLVDEHFLICPINHCQSSANQSAENLQEVERFKTALTKFYKRNNEVAVFFERNYKTSHMQIQAVPIPQDAASKLANILKEESESQGIHLQENVKNLQSSEIFPASVPYFIIELPDGKMLYTKIDGRKGFPLNFAREVLAMGPILNMTNRAEWKDCILTQDEESSLVERLRTAFEPYDIANE